MGIENDEFVIHGPEPAEPLSNATLGEEILRSLLEDGQDEDVMIDAVTKQTLTRRKLLEAACNVAEALRAEGCTTETVVVLSSINNLEFFIPVLASLLIGSTVATLNHNYTPEELTHTLGISKPRISFCSKEVAPKFVALKRRFNYMDKVIVIDSDEAVSGSETLGEFVVKNLRGRHVLPEEFQPFVGDPSKLGAFILCSSGTTGLPKGVLLSHQNIMARVLQSRDPRYARAVQYLLGLLPFFHGYGLNITLNAIINHQVTVVMKKFDEDVFLQSIQDYRLPVLIVAPPLAVFLAKSPKVLQYDLSSVEYIGCGAAPLGKETENNIRKRLKNIRCIQQGYGLTESTLAVTLLNVDENRPGSSGKVVSFMSCKVRDPETGASLGPHRVGELCFKGPMVMMGYYNDEEATRQSFAPGGWLKTGDLGYYDEERYFYIVDRLKELIKYKGFQVAPAELEAILLNHPKVRDVGVVGLPDELSGELPIAFVVKRKGVEVTERELQEYVAGLVSPQKRLRGGVIFVPEIPKNPSGKILRRVLRQQLRRYKEQPKSKL